MFHQYTINMNTFTMLLITIGISLLACGCQSDGEGIEPPQIRFALPDSARVPLADALNRIGIYAQAQKDIRTHVPDTVPLPFHERTIAYRVHLRHVLAACGMVDQQLEDVLATAKHQHIRVYMAATYDVMPIFAPVAALSPELLIVGVDKNGADAIPVDTLGQP